MLRIYCLRLAVAHKYVKIKTIRCNNGFLMAFGFYDFF